MANNITSGVNVFRPEQFKGVEKMVSDIAQTWQQKNLIEQNKIKNFNDYINIGTEGILDKDKQEILGQRKNLEKTAMDIYKGSTNKFMPSAEDQMTLNKSKSDVLRQIELSKQQAKDYSDLTKKIYLDPDKYDIEATQKGLTDWASRSIGDRGDIYENVKLKFNMYDPYENENIVPQLKNVDGNEKWNTAAQAKARADIDSWIQTPDGKSHYERWAEVNNVNPTDQRSIDGYKEQQFDIYRSKIREKQKKSVYQTKLESERAKHDAEIAFNQGNYDAAFGSGMPQQDESGNMVFQNQVKTFKGNNYAAVARVDLSGLKELYKGDILFGNDKVEAESVDVMMMPNSQNIKAVREKYPAFSDPKFMKSASQISAYLGINKKQGQILHKLLQQTDVEPPQTGGEKDQDIFISAEDIKALGAIEGQIQDKIGDPNFKIDYLLSASPYVFYNKLEEQPATAVTAASTKSVPQFHMLDEQWVSKIAGVDKNDTGAAKYVDELRNVANTWNTTHSSLNPQQQSQFTSENRMKVLP